MVNAELLSTRSELIERDPKTVKDLKRLAKDLIQYIQMLEGELDMYGKES